MTADVPEITDNPRSVRHWLMPRLVTIATFVVGMIVTVMVCIKFDNAWQYADGIAYENIERWLCGAMITVLVSTIVQLLATGRHRALHLAEYMTLELRENQKLLETARDAAEAASVAKSQFLANMSHEIRTPLTAILGFSDVLADSDLDLSQHREAAQIVRRNGEQLLTVLNDVLDLAQIEAGDIGLRPEHVVLRNVIEDAATLMRARAVSKRLFLRVNYVSELPYSVNIDPGRLKQMILNLLSNAVKFTDRGGVSMSVNVTQVDGHHTLAIEVKDTGIGICPESLDRLFRPFEQADSSLTRRFGGTGLGLAISRELAEVMGGKLNASSRMNEGSLFSVEVPLEVVQFESPDGNANSWRINEKPTSLDGLRILVADDSEDNRKLLTLMLTRLGASVSFAEDGQQAYEAVRRQLANGRPYDCVLMDIMMPAMDGYEVTRKLRGEGYTGPIVALTAHALAGDREKCIDAGCDECCTKPVNPVGLTRVIASYAQQRLAA